MMLDAMVSAIALWVPILSVGPGDMPLSDAPEVRTVSDSAWAALLDRTVVLQLSSGDVVRGNVLGHDATDVVLSDAQGVVTTYPKDTVVDVRLEEPSSTSQESPIVDAPPADEAKDEPIVEAVSAATMPDCRVDGELEQCVEPEGLHDPVASRRLQWAGIGLLVGGVAAVGTGAGLWTSGYQNYLDAREVYYGSNGTCNTSWDPCGSRSKYDAEKRAGDIRIHAGIASVAVGSALVVSGVVMAIVGGKRSKRARRYGALGLFRTRGGLGPFWTVQF